LEVLPEIVDAVKGSKVEVYVDGGIRKGTDVFKALALGARAVFLGRPIVYGLAYQGEEGVRSVLSLINYEFRLAMALAGKEGKERRGEELSTIFHFPPPGLLTKFVTFALYRMYVDRQDHSRLYHSSRGDIAWQKLCQISF
jgi:hypothetical protein